jgi:outer membrane PBP1 activator LpoA protein
VKRSPLLVLAVLITACSRGNSSDDVPPLPEQTAETANALMSEADRAAGNAAARSATAGAAARSSQASVNEVTP